MKKIYGKVEDYDLDSAILISVLILGFATLTLLSRIGFPTYYYDFFIITGISLFPINFSSTSNYSSTSLTKWVLTHIVP